jgi:ABC-type antimicrobial peptide transport system permease subunit
MSETSFPINDLFRRKMQTTLAIVSLALCVASTLFLLLFAQRVGLGISSAVEGKLTAGFSLAFSPFMTLLTILVFSAGAVVISFTAFIMTSQRTRDIGLMKAAGCPNDVLFGYFFTELLLMAFVGCFFGTILGVVTDLASTGLMSGLGLPFSQQPINVLMPFAVFTLFFILSMILGTAPLLPVIRAEPARAFSPATYLGLAKEPGFKAVSRSRLSLKIAVRTLVRHRSATTRIVVCLSIVFLMVTVAVAGGLIAENTTVGWVEKAIGRGVLVIAHRDMVSQYRLLLSEFYGGQRNIQFNYTDTRYQVPPTLINRLRSMGLAIDARLVLMVSVKEIPGIIFGSSTAQTTTIGDSHQGESLVEGVNPTTMVSDWYLKGEFFGENQTSEAVVGDTLAQALFSSPLDQKIRISGEDLSVVGVCLDPINNGNVTYVPLETLQSITGVSGPNLLMVKLGSAANEAYVDGINATVRTTNPDFQVIELNEVLNNSLDFLSSLWFTIMFLPLFSLVTASLSLVAYVVLTINEQRQEFGILRALGAEPKTVRGIIFTQSLIVALASYAVGVAFGIITTLLVLVKQPVVTPCSVIEIAAWLLLAFAATFLFSVYPAIIFAKKSVLELMTT